MPGPEDRKTEDQADHASAFHECLRCTRGDETRIYQLRRVADGAELWRTEERPGAARTRAKEAHLKAPEEAAALLEELRRALTAGGWR